MKIRGFTLIELLVVVAIISLLSSVVLATLSDARRKAAWTKFDQEILQIKTAIELYKTDNGGNWPDMSYDLDTTLADLNADNLIALETLLDPNGRPYYIYPGIKTDPVFYVSCGSRTVSDAYYAIYTCNGPTNENSRVMSTLYYAGGDEDCTCIEL